MSFRLEYDESSLKKKLLKGKLAKISQGDVSVNYKMRFPK